MPVKTVKGEGHLRGLATLLEATPSIRRHALKHGRLCKWPSVKETGVMCLPNVSLNSEVMKVIISIWCPQHSEGKTIPLEDTKVQARKINVCACSIALLVATHPSLLSWLWKLRPTGREVQEAAGLGLQRRQGALRCHCYERFVFYLTSTS